MIRRASPCRRFGIRHGAGRRFDSTSSPPTVARTDLLAWNHHAARSGSDHRRSGNRVKPAAARRCASWPGRRSHSLAAKCLSAVSRNDPESSAHRISCPNHIFFEQPDEESLRQVLGVAGAVSRPAQVGVERVPILLAQRRQRMSRFRRSRASRQHEVPSRCLETRPRWLRRHRGCPADSFVGPRVRSGEQRVPRPACWRAASSSLPHAPSITTDVKRGHCSLLSALLENPICDVFGWRRVFAEAERVQHLMNQHGFRNPRIDPPGRGEIVPTKIHDSALRHGQGHFRRVAVPAAVFVHEQD